MTNSLHNRVAVVTGAARGIGRACAVAFARAGADVVGIDIAGPVSAILDFGAVTPDDLARTGTAVEGSRIITSSTRGRRGTKDGAAYAASKSDAAGMVSGNPFAVTDGDGAHVTA